MAIRKHRNVLEMTLDATCPEHKYSAGSWDAEMNDVQACPAEAVRMLTVIVFHPRVSTFGFSLHSHCHHPRPGPIVSHTNL